MDVVYDYKGNTSFVQKLESAQYNASLAITCCFRGMSRDKLNSELGLGLRIRPAIYPLDAKTEHYQFFFFLTVFHNGTIWIVV